MAGFLIDENLPDSLATDLVRLGYAAFHACKVGLNSRPDEEVIAYAATNGLAIVTCDRGLAEPRRFGAMPNPGILVCRIPNEILIDDKKQIILSAITSLSPEEIDGSLIIIGRTTLRLRRPWPDR